MTVEIINGSRTSFGPRTTNSDLPASVLTLGVKKQAIVPIKFDDLPTHVEGDVTGHSLPANALVTAVYHVPAVETFDGDYTFNLNLVQDNGTAITTVVSGATVTQLNDGAEATLADATVGSVGPAYIEVVSVAGTIAPTAGEGTMVIEYIEQFTV